MRNYSLVEEFLEREADPAFARRAGCIFRSLKELNNGLKVLDAGCGRGFYLKVLTEAFPDLKLYGIDYNKKYLGTARILIGNKKAELEQGSIEKLPYKKNYFDAVIASEILEHVEHDGAALKEIYRVIKPGGMALITVPNKNYPFLWDPVNWILEKFFKVHLPSNIWWLAGIWADHKRLYNLLDLKKLIKKTKFKTIDVQYLTHYCFPFSHFLFYGIGKNLVELGLLGNFNRFSKKNRQSVLKSIVLFPIRLIDKANNNYLSNNISVNICLKIRK